MVYSFDEVLDTDEGWAKYNRHYWLKDYRGFLEFFTASLAPRALTVVCDNLDPVIRDDRLRLGRKQLLPIGRTAFRMAV